MSDRADSQAVIHLPPGGGRSYALGAITAVFKADEAETGARYSVSEWWLEPHAKGPGAHSHEANDEIFYVIEGVASILAGEAWLQAPKGSFLRDPGGDDARLREPRRRAHGAAERLHPRRLRAEHAGDRRVVRRQSVAYLLQR